MNLFYIEEKKNEFFQPAAIKKSIQLLIMNLNFLAVIEMNYILWDLEGIEGAIMIYSKGERNN